MQGAIGVTHDLNNYWHRTIQPATFITDREELYNSNNYDELQNYNYPTLTLTKWFQIGWKMNYATQYSINKTNIQIKNIHNFNPADTTSYVVKLYSMNENFPYNDVKDVSTGSILATNVDTYSINLAPNQQIIVGNFVAKSAPIVPPTNTTKNTTTPVNNVTKNTTTPTNNATKNVTTPTNNATKNVTTPMNNVSQNITTPINTTNSTTASNIGSGNPDTTSSSNGGSSSGSSGGGSSGGSSGDGTIEDFSGVSPNSDTITSLSEPENTPTEDQSNVSTPAAIISPVQESPKPITKAPTNPILEQSKDIPINFLPLLLGLGLAGGIFYFYKKRPKDLPIHQNLIDYIKKALHDGYSYQAIEKALRNRSIEKSLITYHVELLKFHGYQQVIRYKSPNVCKLPQHKDLMIKLLEEYIHQQVKEGFHIKDIYDALLYYGHIPELIQEALTRGTTQGIIA